MPVQHDLTPAELKELAIALCEMRAAQDTRIRLHSDASELDIRVQARAALDEIEKLHKHVVEKMREWLKG